MNESIKKGDVLRLEVAATGVESMLFVNGQLLTTVYSVELRIVAGKPTMIRVELSYPNNEPVIYEGKFTPLEDA